MNRLLLHFTLLAGLALGGLAQPAPLARQTAEGFAVPQYDPVFTFPRAHGSHPDFRVEWWYLTGQLATSTGRKFGFQVTFFRRGFTPGGTGPRDQLYLAHVALTDPASGRFLHQERLARAGGDADASTETLDLRNGPWTLRWTEDPTPRLLLQANLQGEAALSLTLLPAKPLVLFGDRGVSRKGDAPTAASHYLTFSRLTTQGELRLGVESLSVTGTSWMDHEISSSQLDTDQVGWDWFGLHLSDGREIMLYQLRQTDGQVDPVSRLTWVDEQGRTAVRPFTWRTVRTWRSPVSGGNYPVEFEIDTVDPRDERPLTLRFRPWQDAQEWPGTLSGIPYWEGACTVDTDRPGLTGGAYVELTGYAKELKF